MSIVNSSFIDAVLKVSRLRAELAFAEDDIRAKKRVADMIANEIDVAEKAVLKGARDLLERHEEKQ